MHTRNDRHAGVGICGGFALASLLVVLPACALEPADDQEPVRSADPEHSNDLTDLAAAKIAETGAKRDLSRHAFCGQTGPNLQNTVVADAAINGAANQRNGSVAQSPTACPIVGVLQPTDDARYFCFTQDFDGFTWTYLQNLRTGVRGWTRDNLLRSFGSSRPCGF